MLMWPQFISILIPPGKSISYMTRDPEYHAQGQLGPHQSPTTTLNTPSTAAFSIAWLWMVNIIFWCIGFLSTSISHYKSTSFQESLSHTPGAPGTLISNQTETNIPPSIALSQHFPKHCSGWLKSCCGCINSYLYPLLFRNLCPTFFRALNDLSWGVSAPVRAQKQLEKKIS